MADATTVLVAAGLVGGDIAALSVAEMTERLKSLLCPSSLWVRGGADGRPLDDLRALGEPPFWSAPATVAPAQQELLAEAWAAALAGYSVPGDSPAVLRLQVGSLEDAKTLTAAGDVGGIRLVAFVGHFNHRFAWRWPLRVAVAPGPNAAAWKDELDGGHFAGTLYSTRIASPGEPEPIEVLIVDGDAPPSPDDLRLGENPACVAVVGTTAPPADLLQHGVAFDSAIVFAVPGPGVAWFLDFIAQLAHDLPADVAISLAVPGTPILANPMFVDLTGAARWTAAVAEQGDTGADVFRGIVSGRAFGSEGDGASDSSKASTDLAQAGTDTTLRRSMPMAAAPPPAMDEEFEAEGGGAFAPPPPPKPPRKPKPKGPRFLLADITRDGEVVETALQPNAGHELVVWIGFPRRPELGIAVIDESKLPKKERRVPLTVDVTDDNDPAFHETSDITLSTKDRAKESTVAHIPFRTGGDGTGVSLKVVVLYDGRPLQAMRVNAVVAQSGLGMVQRMRIELSSLPEPAPTVTGADVTLDFTDPVTVKRRGKVPKGAIANFDDLATLLDKIEERASDFLGVSNAPSSLDDEDARQLLVDLARIGKPLRDKLADLLITDDDRTIALIVRFDSKILPIELTYDGPLPNKSAKLCGDHRKRPPPAGERCSQMSKTVVCPYGFWGMRRVVARTIEGGRPSKRTQRVELERLSLRPVLYAAADIADRDLNPGDTKPSVLLERALAKIVGARRLTRVSSWSEWRLVIRRGRPQMLVVLGHTQTKNKEPSLQIGPGSDLAFAAIERDVLAGKVAAPPLLLLFACESAVLSGIFGALPATFTDKGAAAVVATLNKLNGPQGAATAAEVVRSLHSTKSTKAVTLGAALMQARRKLVGRGLLVGLLLVSHGEIDLTLKR